jgi:Ni,Fe-hydrogenase III component G
MSEKLIKLKEQIEILSNFHQIEILKIFKKYDEVILNENKNGIFINMSHISYNIINEIEEYLSYVKTQESHIKIIENEKKKLSDKYFQTSKENIFTSSI